MALLSIVICTSSVAGEPKQSNLDLSGFFITKSNVHYEVYEYTEDCACTVVKSKTGIRSYKSSLEVGKEYLIVFTKDTLVKKLHIVVGAEGEMDLDIDFSVDYNAKIEYNKEKKSYELLTIKPNTYGTGENNQHLADGRGVQ